MTDLSHQIRHNRPGRNGMPSVLRPSLLGYCALPTKFGKNDTVGEQARIELASHQTVDQLLAKCPDARITTPTSFNTQWYGSAIRKPVPLIRGRLGSELYCPPAFRPSVSPINHGDEAREWSTSSGLVRSVSNLPTRFMKCADGSGTGFATGVCRATELWDSGPLTRETSYRRSFSVPRPLS